MDSIAGNRGVEAKTGKGEWVASQPAWRHFLMVVGGLVLLWCLPLAALAKLALKSDIHSHVLLVPLVSIYVLWTERFGLPASGTPSWKLAGLLGAGSLAVLGWAQWGGGESGLSLRILAFVLAVQTAAAITLGTKILRAASFSFGFLLFMVPLTPEMIQVCEQSLQHASAVASEWYFILTGVAHVRKGQEFYLPGITIEVAQECSGFRSTLVLLIVSVVAARLFLLTTWRRLALVFVILPLGILRNGFRIWVLAVLTVNVDPRVIDSPLHHQGGPIFFVISLVPLFGFLWLLYRSERALRGPTPSASLKTVG